MIIFVIDIRGAFIAFAFYKKIYHFSNIIIPLGPLCGYYANDIKSDQMMS